MTKSVRTFTLKDLNKFLTIYKDNANTNRCFVSTMVNDIFQSRTIVKPLHNNLPQIILKCSTKYNDSNSRQTSRCSTQDFASNEREADESSPPVLSSSSTRNSATQKAVQRGRKSVRYEKDWSSEETGQLIDLWCSRPVLYNTSLPEYMDKNKKSQAIKEISEEMGIEQDLIARKTSSLRTYYGQLRQKYLSFKNQKC